MTKKLFYTLALAILSPWLCLTAQLKVESGATFFIGSGATVTVEGNVSSATDLQGTGNSRIDWESGQAQCLYFGS